MTFNEEWFGPDSCRVLMGLAKQTNHLGGRVVEVGSWEGRSTVALAHAVYPSNVNAVDTWNGSPGEISAELAQQRDVYTQFLANVEALTRGNVVPHRDDWGSYFARDKTPIRFLFIDATHTYDEVKANIEVALPLMVPGGIVCGDDSHHPPVISAARDVLGDVDIDVTLWIWKVPDG